MFDAENSSDSSDSLDSPNSDWSKPSYMVAADNHNIGNLNPSLFSDTDHGNLITRAGKFIASSALSGVNSFYNTAVWAGNLFSSEEAQYRDTREWIAEFDEDLGAYYQDNRQAADLVGFVATSFVPGLGGVKVFNAGVKALTAAKEGRVATNMARGLGVLPGQRDTLVKAAVKEFAETRTAFTATNANTLKAVAAGFGEQALQAAAFETAVVLTMHKSPILDDMDAGDLVSNIAMGAILGGAIGGVIEGAGTVAKIKQGIKLTDAKLAGVTQDLMGPAGTSASDSLLIIRNDLDTLAQNPPEGVDPALYAKLWEDKLQRLDNKSREHFTTLAGGDAKVGNILYEGLRVDPTGSYSGKLLNLMEITPHHSAIKTRVKYNITDDNDSAGVRYLKLWGDDAGKISEEAPSAVHLADISNEPLKVTSTFVQAGKTKFEINLAKPWQTSGASYEEALARNIWAMDESVPRLESYLGPSKPPMVFGHDDIPLLTKAYREGFFNFKLRDDAGNLIEPPKDLEGLQEYIKRTKDAGVTKELETALAQGEEIPAEKLANKWDVPLGFLTGEQYSANVDDAIFGLAKAKKDYFNRTGREDSPWMIPQNYEMFYKTAGVDTLDNFQVEAMTVIRERQKLQQEQNEYAVASVLAEKSTKLPDLTDAELSRVSRTGAGAGFFSFANSSYGSAGSKAEYVGSLVTNWVREAGEAVANRMVSVNYNMLNKPGNMEALAAVMTKVRAAGSNHYVLDPQNPGRLVLKSVRDYEAKIASGIPDARAPVIPPGIDRSIDMPADVAAWAKEHISINGHRVQSMNNLRGAKGQPEGYDPDVFYPPAPNPKRFKYHAFVLDDNKVTSTGNSTMLYADSAENLEKQIAEARRQGFNVVTPDQTKEYHKARGTYDHTMALNDFNINSALTREGASAPAFPLTGTPQEMIQDIMEWHAKQEAIVIREAVSTKYSRQFGTLHQMGAEYSSLNQATFGFKSKFQGEAKNPFEDYVKTFLGASLKGDYPLWTALNNFVDEAGSKVYNTVKKLASGSKNVYDLEKVNDVFKSYGLQMAATPAQMEAWVNHPAGNMAVSKFISQQNAILATLTLRLDPVNALNNAVGANVLTGAETASVLRGIAAGNENAVGELAQLMKIDLPGSDGDKITSASKLIANAYKEFFGPNRDKILARYKENRYVSDVSHHFVELLETATLKGTETAAELNSKSAKMFALFQNLADKGEKWTGNKVAEEMNRFVAANVMDQITSIAVKHGLMDQKSADAYINTFVNRTQGNMIASQRPQLFQGPVGQAIGLFQTYQFNIMQQLLRYVGEGQKKDALTLLGLQGTIYGMNGLPGFQAINQHIIGTASGNPEHRDMYSETNRIFGKGAGDWLTYGVASNMLIDPDLKINLYSRGDINPRQITVVPTNVADVPFVAAWTKAVSALKGTAQSISGGGDVWNSILNGIEQNGISRPLAGIARVARGLEGGVSYSTSSNGNVVSANDLLSLANLARISGAKPFDEAVTQDAVFRIQAYQAVDKKRRDKLSKAVKSAVQGGDIPSAAQMESFAASYAKAGGKQEEFTKWYMQQLRQADTPQANKIIESNKTQYSEYMQLVMGGRMMATPPNFMAPIQEEQ